MEVGGEAAKAHGKPGSRLAQPPLHSRPGNKLSFQWRGVFLVIERRSYPGLPALGDRPADDRWLMMTVGRNRGSRNRQFGCCLQNTEEGWRNSILKQLRIQASPETAPREEQQLPLR